MWPFHNGKNIQEKKKLLLLRLNLEDNVDIREQRKNTVAIVAHEDMILWEF